MKIVGNFFVNPQVIQERSDFNSDINVSVFETNIRVVGGTIKSSNNFMIIILK